jgi:hypothetical protein
MTHSNPYDSTDVGREGELAGDREFVSGWGIYCIAAIHLIAALLVGWLIIIAWNPGDLHEALPWMLVAAVLMALAVGLWRRRRWARLVALIIHWPTFAGSLLLLPLCVIFLLVDPAGEMSFFHPFAFLGVIFLSPALLLSGCTVWYLHSPTARRHFSLRELFYLMTAIALILGLIFALFRR